MGYILLLLATLAWSFVGILVKAASGMADSSVVTFARFALGIVFLGAFLLLKEGKIDLRGGLPWIWAGALGKCCNYYFENLAISIGYAYGNILVPPIQTVTLLILSVMWLKEPVRAKGWAAAAVCIFGVLVISWNGQPLDRFAGGGSALTSLLFALSAVGAAIHVLSQKMLLRRMDNGSMNFSIFFWCSVLMAIPLPLQHAGMIGPPTFWAWAALVALGLITGLSFVWFSEALRRVSFPVAIIVSNSGVVFTILWSYLFYREPITGFVMAGAAAFFAGMLLLHLPFPVKAGKRLEA